MDYSRLRDPHEVPLYLFSVLVNLLIIALIVVGALLVGFLNALAGDPLSGPMVEVIRVAFVALLLLVPGLVVHRQITRAGTRGSAVRLSRGQFPDIYALKEDFARRLGLSREPEIYLMSGNGTLNAFAASTFGYDFVVIHSELFSNTYEKNKEALAFIVGHELGHLRLGHTRLWYQLSTAYVDRVPLLRHDRDDEAWYVLEGVLAFRVNDAEVKVPAGGGIVVLRGTAHTFWNPSARPARYLIVMTATVYRLVEALHSRSGHADLDALFREHDSTLLGWL